MWLCNLGCAWHLLSWVVFKVVYWFEGYICESGSHLRPNRWREKECEQKVSNMEVLLIVSPQLFLFSVCQFWLGAHCTMRIVQDGLFAEGGPEWMRICFWRGDRQPRVNSLFSICTMLCFCTEYAPVEIQKFSFWWHSVPRVVCKKRQSQSLRLSRKKINIRIYCLHL